jgi:hypothetical protein
MSDCIWRKQDLSGNGPEAVAINTSREAIGNRVDTRTADMLELPFPNAHRKSLTHFFKALAALAKPFFV